MTRRPCLSRLRLLAGAAAIATLAGCSSGGFQGIYSLPLPGGPSLGSHPYTVKAIFGNVVDLVPHATVRVNDVAVGSVISTTVPSGSWNATVTMKINGSVHLPANTIASLASASLLGEEYVALGPPPNVAPSGTLPSNATIPLASTTTNVTVEQVLGALSMLLNAGGLAQVHSITTELNKAMSGNQPQIRSLLSEVNTLMTNLNAHRTDITAALQGLDSLSATLQARDAQIGDVLDNLKPGLQVLTQERNQLVTMLNSLHNLTHVAVQTINASKSATIADLTALQPILMNLANAGKALPQSLQVLVTYPFSDQLLKDVKGDYLNAFLHVTAKKGTCVYAPLVPGNQLPQSTKVLTCPPQP